MEEKNTNNFQQENLQNVSTNNFTSQSVRQESANNFATQPTIQGSSNNLGENKYEEKSKKKNNSMFILIIILILAVAGLGGFIVYDKFSAPDEKPNNDVNDNGQVSDGNNENNEQNIENNGTINQAPSNNPSISLPNCLDGCTLEYEGFKFEIGRDSNGSKQTLKINGKSVLEDIGFFKTNMTVHENIKFIQDIAIIRVISNMQVFVFAFDKQGNQLLSTMIIDTKFGENMVLAVFDEGVDRMTIEGNKIKLKATRFSDGPSIRGENVPVINESISCDTIVEGTYEIEYLGNGKFSEIKNTSYTLLKDSYAKEYAKCQ